MLLTDFQPSVSVFVCLLMGSEDRIHADRWETWPEQHR